MDKIRCTNCRGMKQVAKLGGMMGDCNLCGGRGTIDEVDRPKIPLNTPIEVATDLIHQVAACVPTSTLEIKSKADVPKEEVIKINPKKAVYRRKKA